MLYDVILPIIIHVSSDFTFLFLLVMICYFCLFTSDIPRYKTFSVPFSVTRLLLTTLFWKEDVNYLTLRCYFMLYLRNLAAIMNDL